MGSVWVALKARRLDFHWTQVPPATFRRTEAQREARRVRQLRLRRAMREVG